MNERLESPTTQSRHDQAFPVLSSGEVDRLRRFGTVHRYRDGEHVIRTGERSPGMFAVLSGAIRMTGRDGHGHDLPIVEHGPGMFSGELNLLAARPSFVDGIAEGNLEAILIDSDGLHSLLVSEALLGEKIMRALILRRVGLIESGAGGPVLVGADSLPGVARLRGFLTRNGVPHLLLDPATDPDARAFIERFAPVPGDLPLVICADGTMLRNPTEVELARCIGMVDSETIDHEYDVAIVGAGPAGLAAAVYAASEGLSVVVLDARAFGGQAGASARIENYFGFPTGISGLALTARAYNQAQKFGARILIPAEVATMTCDVGSLHFTLSLADGTRLGSRTVVIASGARYRRPDLPALAALEGRGVWFWASPIEAKMCAGQEVVLVGGGNSAGQAAVFLSAHAAKVWMLVRSQGLAASMSKYLIDRIDATPNIELLTRTSIVAAAGASETGLDSVTWRRRDTEEETTRAIRHVFLFLGAEPSTAWLAGCGVETDAPGFVRTGGAAGRQSLETSLPGVFAIGDVRSGSTKRVGAAIGEGANVVSQIHAHLAAHSVHADVVGIRQPV